MVSGQVAKVLVTDTAQVKQGDILVEIDNRDATIALAQAKLNWQKQNVNINKVQPIVVH